MTDMTLHLDPESGDRASIHIDWRDGFCDRIDVDFNDGWLLVRFNGTLLAKRFVDDEEDTEYGPEDDDELDDDLSQFDDHVPPI